MIIMKAEATDEQIAVLNQQIDRFSISWFWNQITCSICNNDWYQCSHWPGREYDTETQRQGDRENSPPLPLSPSPRQVCELIFETPRGRETSAVNTPAVIGTGIENISLMEKTNMEPAPVYTVTPVGAGSPSPTPSPTRTKTPLPTSPGFRPRRLVRQYASLG